MTQATIAIILSSVSIVIAFTSLFWNIYRDVLLRPRSEVVCGVSYIRHGDKERGPFIDLRLTNKGPGTIIVTNIIVHNGGFLRRLLRIQKKATVMYDYTNELNPKMPTQVAQYQSITQYLDFDKDCFLKGGATRFGFIDTLNRYHWARRRYLRKLLLAYRRHFC
ncbi:MAG: hypothetical protein ABFD90_03910 [Phycisphaerales bacterium]